MVQEANIFCIKTLVSNRTRCRKRIAKQLTKDPIQRPLQMGCTTKSSPNGLHLPPQAWSAWPPCTFCPGKLKNDVRHYRKSKAGFCNNLFAIFHFTGLAKELYRPGAKIVVIMDVSDLAQMMPKWFAGKNILKGYKHCISSLGRLRWHRRCKPMQQNIIN
jgi:hypothetical protein